VSEHVPKAKNMAESLTELMALLMVSGENALKNVLKTLNSISYPALHKDIVMLMTTIVSNEKQHLSLKDITDAFAATDSIIENPDLYVALLIVALKTFFDINTRRSTLVRTMLRPKRISENAPLFTVKDEEVRKVTPGKLRIITDYSDLPSVAKAYDENEPIGLTEDQITDEELAMEAEFAKLMAEDLKEIRDGTKIITETKFEASGEAASTLFSEDYFDYKQMTGEVQEAEARFDTMLVSSSNINEAIIESAKSAAESYIMRFTKKGYNLFSKNQFITSKFGPFESTLMSLLTDASKSMSASLFVFLFLV
jgi:hypothetical protein